MFPARTTPNIIGLALGWAIAPFVALVSATRRSRMFHPEGIIFSAEVKPVASRGEISPAAAALEGHALLRFSTAWWKGKKEWIDALGIGLRLTREPPRDSAPREGDQDLLFATIRFPWTTPLAPLTTNPHDFLANDFYAVSPFEWKGLGRVKLRLKAPRVGITLKGRTREERLVEAVERGVGIFDLEVKHPGTDRRWKTMARVRLKERVALDQEELRFDPYRVGRGILPVGFVHALRVGVYAAGQATRTRLRPSEPATLKPLPRDAPGQRKP